MKIGLLAPDFPPDLGGVQTYSWHTASELARLGHDVTVFTREGRVTDAAAPGFKVESVLALRRRRDRRTLLSHTMDVWHCLDATQAWLALDTAPVFVTVHGNDFLAPYHPVGRLDLGISDRLERWLGDRLTRDVIHRALPRAAHIFTNSRYTEEVFLRHCLACRGRTSVASVGVPDEDFAEHQPGDSGEPTRLITVCRLNEARKNVAAVLRALGELCRQHDFHYTIVGEGELLPGLRALAAELGLADRVSFTGAVSRDQKIDLLRSSDLFVLAATADSKSYEGFGIAYLEANACGTPVLAARAGGAVEAVDEGVSGYFVEQSTAQAIAGALERFLRGELRFTADSCVHFARRFSWRAVVEHTVAHYDDAMGPSAREPRREQRGSLRPLHH